MLLHWALLLSMSLLLVCFSWQKFCQLFQYENLDYGSIKPALARARDSIATLKSVSQTKQADWQKELLEWEQQQLSDDSYHLVTVKTHFFLLLYWLFCKLYWITLLQDFQMKMLAYWHLLKSSYQLKFLSAIQ